MKNNRFSKPPILWESSLGDFQRSSRTLNWKSSFPSTDNSAETFWNVQTNFRLQTFLEFKKLEFLLHGLPEEEQQMLFDGPGVLKDRFFLESIAAFKTDIPREILLQRLDILCSILDRARWGNQLFRTLRGPLNYRIRLIQKPIRKAKKFSGWIRNASAAGSKRFGRGRPEPETFEWVLGDEIDYFHILTVGEFSMNQEVKFLSLKSPIRTKR